MNIPPEKFTESQILNCSNINYLSSSIEKNLKMSSKNCLPDMIIIPTFTSKKTKYKITSMVCSKKLNGFVNIASLQISKSLEHLKKIPENSKKK